MHIFKLGIHKATSNSSDPESATLVGSSHDSEEGSVQGSDGGFEFVGKEKSHNIS